MAPASAARNASGRPQIRLPELARAARLPAHFAGFRTTGTTGMPSASSDRHSARPERPDAPMT